MQPPCVKTNSGDVVHVSILALGLGIIVLAARTGSAAALSFAVVLFCCILVGFASIAAKRGADISFFLLIPTVMSAFQNIYLAPFALEMSPGGLQVVIVVNFIYAALLYLALLVQWRSSGVLTPGPTIRNLTMIMFVVTFYGLAMMVLQGNNIQAALASARNILSPFLFLLIGYYAAAYADLRRYLGLAVLLGWAVLAAAVLEYLLPGFWEFLQLHHLWGLKGIDVNNESLLPHNFYASEQIVAGEFIRRMAGPFADPVNFGTFLFAITCVAWFMRSKLLVFATLVATALTVSKGAVLGILTLLTVWAKKYRSRFEFSSLGALTLVAALYLYAFTQSSSTGSASAHISGLLAAIIELPSHPAGRGFGGTGVLAGLFTDESSKSASAILESGLGMVVGQLGIVGLLAYVCLFTMIIRAVSRVRDIRTRVLGLALAVAFLLNAAFNEVALSPNSSGIYFVILGLIVASSERDSRGLSIARALPAARFDSLT